MEEKQKIKLQMSIMTEDVREADKLVRKMLSTLEFEQLEMIGSCKLQVTQMEVEVMSDVFKEQTDR